MKRFGNLFEKIISIENLNIADVKAQKGKKNQYGVVQHNKNVEKNIESLHLLLKEGNYKTSPYKKFLIFEPKEREIFVLPYYPDRIVHHAIMNILEPIFVQMFVADTYSCIKNRGIHGAMKNLRIALTEVSGTTYCLKLDIKKFYPNIDHDILKSLLRRKFKDVDLLKLLDEIIDSCEGIPIGNYLSQFFANFYLTYLDHWLKEDLKIRHYFRYADDIVILHSDKNVLHEILFKIRMYLLENLKLHVKQNYQIFPVEARGIDFVGYKFYHTHTLLRKSIKKKLVKAVLKGKNHNSIMSYYGWAVHADSKNLLRSVKLLKNN